MGDVLHDVSVSGGKGFGSSKTFAVTIGDHDDRMLLVAWQHATGVGSSTYNASAMTYLSYATQSPYCKVRAYKMLNPPKGTHNVVISFGANGSFNCGASSFYNVDQDTPHTTPTTTAGWGTAITNNHTAASDQLVWDIVGGDEDIGAPSAGTGQTVNWSSGGFSGYPVAWSGSSRETGLGGTTPMTWTMTWSRYAGIAIAMNPVPTSAGPTAIAMFYERYDGFMKKVKKGLLPPSQLEKEYGLMMSAAPQGVCL